MMQNLSDKVMSFLISKVLLREQTETGRNFSVSQSRLLLGELDRQTHVQTVDARCSFPFPLSAGNKAKSTYTLAL